MDSSIWTALALGALVLSAAACTAGGEEIPEGDGGGGAGPSSGGALTQGGSAGTPVATGGMMPLGGSGGAPVMTGGTGGSAGSVAGGTGRAVSGGSAGTTAGPPDPQLNNGTPYRLDMERLYEDGGTPLSSCSEGEVCWVAENDTPANPHSETEVIPMGGDPNTIYRITVRIRGIIEPKNYTNGCEPMFMRATNPQNETRSIYVCKASATTS